MPLSGHSWHATATGRNAPHLPFAIPAGIGSLGWITDLRRSHGEREACAECGRLPDPSGTARPDPQETFWATPADHGVGQKAVIRVRLLDMPTPAHVSSSSSTFASLRSGVSKPSVNQS